VESAQFPGPGRGFAGLADIVLPLSRPIKFDRIICRASAAGSWIMTWVGDDPEP